MASEPSSAKDVCEGVAGELRPLSLLGEVDLAVAPCTTDGDLALNAAALAETPPLEHELIGAGLLPKAEDIVGIWITHWVASLNPNTEVAIDLLVPASVTPGRGRRAGRLPGHDARVARIVNGLESAIVDADRMTLAALEPDDPRAFDIRVAGPAAPRRLQVRELECRRDA